jgi:hypothetical protein
MPRVAPCAPHRLPLPVTFVQASGAKVRLANGSELVASQVVVATGGLFMDPALTGVLSPSWSYLVSRAAVCVWVVLWCVYGERVVGVSVGGVAGACHAVGVSC